MISKKIFKNTIMLYSRQVFLLLVSLYTVRVVLSTLGVEDYGIYTVVGGIVSLLSFITTSMSSATQRFFSFALGKEEKRLLNSTFSMNMLLYGVIGMLAVIVMEVGGYWFISEHLNIPEDRVGVALVVFHYTAATFFFTVITAPFISIIIAHEDMHFFAFISIVEGLLKLAAVFLLAHITWDKLELYGLLIFIVTVLIAVTYLLTCMSKYSECQFKKFYWDKKVLKELFSFTGWSLFGQLTTVARYQAVTILLNQFFNPSVAAARAIAMVISSKVNIFSNNFSLGLSPSIVKNYANNDKSELFALIINGSKLTFFLMWVFALPLLIEMKTVLTIWLGELPEHVVLFSKLALIESLIFSLSMPIAAAARATGQVKYYELILGSMQLSILLLAYIAMTIGWPAYSVFVIAIFVNVLMFFARLSIVSYLIKLSKYNFIKNVLFPMFFVVLISSFVAFFSKQMLPHGVLFSILNLFVSFFVSCICMYYLGLDKSFRYKVVNYLSSKFLKKGGLNGS